PAATRAPRRSRAPPDRRDAGGKRSAGRTIRCPTAVDADLDSRTERIGHRRRPVARRATGHPAPQGAARAWGWFAWRRRGERHPSEPPYWPPTTTQPPPRRAPLPRPRPGSYRTGRASGAGPAEALTSVRERR